MGEGFVRPQQELTKQQMIAENAKRRHITTRHQQQQHHHSKVDKHSVVPNSHQAITKEQVAELLASKHAQITSPLEPQKTQLKKNGQAQITREQVNGSYSLISILEIF